MNIYTTKQKVSYLNCKSTIIREQKYGKLIGNKGLKKFDSIGNLKNHIDTLHIRIEQNGIKPSGYMSDKYQAYMKTEEYSSEHSKRGI